MKIVCKVNSAKQRVLSMGIRLVFLAGILSLLLVAIPTAKPVAGATSGDWPTFLGNNARTGFNAAETIINPKTAPHLKLHWTHSTSSQISAEPVEVNGMVYWVRGTVLNMDRGSQTGQMSGKLTWEQ